MYKDTYYDRNTGYLIDDPSGLLGNRISKNRYSGGGRSSGAFGRSQGMKRKYDFRLMKMRTGDNTHELDRGKISSSQGVLASLRTLYLFLSRQFPSF